MPSNAYLMIHKPATVAAGNSDDMLQAAEFLDVIQQGLESTYQKAAKPDLDAKKIHSMVEHETWLTGTEAAALFDIELLGAVPVLNCYAGKAGARTIDELPKGIVLKADADTRPVFDCVEADKLNEAARIKAALAIAKGVLCK